eukprot:3499139-Karenia_brevis.AAC.1
MFCNPSQTPDPSTETGFVSVNQPMFMQKILTRGAYTDWQRSEAFKMVVDDEKEIYNEKWLSDLKFPKLPRHS